MFFGGHKLWEEVEVGDFVGYDFGFIAGVTGMKLSNHNDAAVGFDIDATDNVGGFWVVSIILTANE